MSGFLVLISANNSLAEIYKYTDAQGGVHYSQTKPEAQVPTKTMNIKTAPAKKIEPETSVTPNDLLSESCEHGDSFIRDNKVFCCTSRCLRDRIEKGLEYSCADPRCHQAASKIKQDIALRDKKEKDEALTRTNAIKEEKMITARDKKIVDDCNKRHEIYCNNSAENIVKAQQEEAKRIEELDRENREAKIYNRGKNVPRDNQNDIYIR